jgi:hypothetical protein
MLAPLCFKAHDVECRIRSERGNRPCRSQRDSTRNRSPEEGVFGLPRRHCRPEKASARARAPASASGQESRARCSRGGERRLRLAGNSVQCTEHRVPTASSRLVSSRMRAFDRRLGPVDLQLGGRQGTPASSTYARHLCAQKPSSPGGKRDTRDAQSGLGPTVCARCRLGEAPCIRHTDNLATASRPPRARRMRAASDPLAIIRGAAVAVAQLVESRIVIPVVVGSSPISHPNESTISAARSPHRAGTSRTRSRSP